MGRGLELLLLGGACGGLAWYITRPSKASTPQLLPPGPPPPNLNEERIKTLAAQVSAETQKQEALQAQVKSLSAAAAAAPPAQKKQLEDAKLKLVLAATQGAEKQKALKHELAERAQAEQAAKKAAEAKAAKGPMYPVGLQAKFAGKSAQIKRAWQDGQGNWHYMVDLETGLPWPANKLKDKAISEVELRKQLAERGGIVLQPGQFYGQGLEVYRNGQGGYIEKAEKNAAGTFTYQLRGWPNVVSQSELQGILTR